MLHRPNVELNSYNVHTTERKTLLTTYHQTPILIYQNYYRLIQLRLSLRFAKILIYIISEVLLKGKEFTLEDPEDDDLLPSCALALFLTADMALSTNPCAVRGPL